MRVISIVAQALVSIPLLSACREPPPKYRPAKSDYGVVHAAWNYAGTWHTQVPPNLKLVAADIALPGGNGRFDLEDIGIFDADTGDWFGSDPWRQRLTPDGEFVDGNDPVLKDREDYRGVFIWAVSHGVRRVNFGYWGETLYRDATPLQERALTVPNPDWTSCGWRHERLHLRTVATWLC